MFPEGRRGEGTHLGPAQRGVGILAERTGASVVPVYHQGAGEVLPRGARLPRWAPLTVLFGRPLSAPRGLEGDRGRAEEWSRQLMKEIAALRESSGCGKESRWDERRGPMDVTESLQRRRTVV